MHLLASQRGSTDKNTMEVCRSSKSREACKASTKNPQSMQSIHSNHGLEFRSQYEVNDNVVSLWMFCGYYPFLLKIDLCDRKRKHFTELNRCQVDLFPDTSLLYQHTTEAVVHKYRYMIFLICICVYIYTATNFGAKSIGFFKFP